MASFIDKGYTYAVVGASRDEDKYGFKVLKDLLDDGFDVVPINPHAQTIMGLRVFLSLAAVSRRIDVVVFVVPPSVAESVLREVLALGITRVWLQPGAESEAAIAYCEEHGIAYMHDACIMRSH